MVKLRKYEVETNEFALSQRLKREKATSEGEISDIQGNLRKNCSVIKFIAVSKKQLNFSQNCY
jgi:hypothetical protein